MCAHVFVCVFACVSLSYTLFMANCLVSIHTLEEEVDCQHLIKRPHSRDKYSNLQYSLIPINTKFSIVS